MKALTILQPYASLIALPDDHPRAKRVENRTWPTGYRGELAIHAGLSRSMLEEDELDPSIDAYGLKIDDMPFGAVIALADLAGCFRVGPGDRWALQRWPWLSSHEHAEGPCCFVLADVRKLSEPIPLKGRQGLWDVDANLADVIRRRAAGGHP